MPIRSYSSLSRSVDMRILIVTQYFWPEQFRVNDLALLLKDRGHEVTILTGMPNYPVGTMFDGYSWWGKRRDEFKGIRIFRAPIFLRRQGLGWQLALNYLSFVISSSLLGPWVLRNLSVDLVFVFAPSPFTVGIPAVLFRQLKKVPLVFWVQDLWPESLISTGAIKSPAILRTVGHVVRWIYKHCDRVLVQSPGFIDPAVAAGAIRSRTSYFPNWAENFYQPTRLEQSAAERLEVPKGFCVMFAGNMGEAQSLETVLHAATLLRNKPDIHWVMVGDGRRRAWLQEEVENQELQTHFHFLGRKPAEQMPRYFSLADIMLVTLKDEPAFALTIPSKVQSYLACGKPVVAALNGDGAKVVRDSEGGLAVAAGDANGLANAISTLYSMSSRERETMGAKGRAFFEKEFSTYSLISSLESLMHEVKEVGRCES